MARNLNRASLIGRLGKDPELKTLPSGSSVCSFSLATSEKYKDKNGEWKEVTDWHNIVIWDKLADIANQYLRKGKLVFIEGKIKTRSYEKDGITRYATEIVATELIMLDGKDGSTSSYPEAGERVQSTASAPESHLADEAEDDFPF